MVHDVDKGGFEDYFVQQIASEERGAFDEGF